MFAPAAKPQAKSTESPGSKRAAALPTLMSWLSGGGAKEHAHALQRSIGNQATLRLIGRRAAGNELGRDTEQDVERSILDIGISRDSGTVPVLARQTQNDVPPPVPTTGQAEREREVEAINVGGIDYVLYQTKVRGGGSSSWLANNPGNLDYTADTVAWGCYEDKTLKWGKHRFAIFPDEATGLAAVRGFLRKHQTTRDITLMMNLFAPATDENNPTQYSQKVAERIGPPVTVHTLVKDLSDDQIQIFAEAIKDQEGWTPGPVNDVPRGDPSLPEGVRDR